jgi:Iron-containing redox enzyme
MRASSEANTPVSARTKDHLMTQYSFCDVAYIQQSQYQPTADIPAGDRVGAAFRESSLLAHNAFVVGDTAARAQAERVLYALHAYHGFGQPMDGVLSTVWGNIFRAKLRSVMTDHVGGQSLTFVEMCSIMGAAVDEADRRDHPLLETLDDSGLRMYARNWYTSTHGFEEQLISILKRSSYQVRQLLFANLADELDTNGFAHVELRAATLRNFGVDHNPDRGGVLDHGAAFADPDVVTDAFAVSNVRTAFSLLPDPAFALGCFYSIEACFPAVCRRILTLLRRRGSTEQDLFYWSLHGEVDESHSAEWLEGIKRAALPDDVHARIANGAISHLLARSKLFAAIADRLARAARQPARRPAEADNGMTT